MSLYNSSLSTFKSLFFFFFFYTFFTYLFQCIYFRGSHLPTPTLQLTAFAFRDYVRFGYVDQGDTHNTRLLRQFNINTYAPTMLLFKEDTEKPVDIIQVQPAQLAAYTIASLILY